MAVELEQALRAHRTGRFEEAEALYRSVLRTRPNDADALALLGCLLSTLKHTHEAVDLVRRAIEIDPASPLFKFYLGNAWADAGNFIAAEEAYRAALFQKNNFPQVHYNLGNVLREQGRWDEARQSYEDALKFSPTYPEARNNLALCYEHSESFDLAISELQALLKQHPTYADAWLNLCRVAESAGQYKLAIEAGKEAQVLMPENPKVYLGIGVALNKMNWHAEALEVYRAAVGLNPDYVDAWDNIGQTFQFMNHLPEAQEAYEKAIDLAGQRLENEDIKTPDEKAYGNRYWHLALLNLLRGDYAHGFARYRARFGELGLRRPSFPAPLWKGEDLKDKTILVGDEQGAGDTMMLARYLPLLKERGAHVKFLISSALAPYFKGWPGADEIIERGQPLSAFDYHTSTFDLPFVFGTRLESIPSKFPYLPLPEIDEPHQLAATSFYKVGIIWAGSPLHKHDGRRSVPLALFAHLFSTPGVRFYNLNRDRRPGDLQILAQHEENIVNLVPQLSNFKDLAAYVAQMDLIICCDTAIAHMAGGMGKNAWVLLPFAPDWRWLTDRKDSLWYPTLRLFRQKDIDDWSTPLAEVKEALLQATRAP